MERLDHIAISTINTYYKELPYKGDDFAKINDIMFYLIYVSLFKWTLFYGLNVKYQEDIRSKIEHYIQLHPSITMWGVVSNDDYKNVNDSQTNYTWARVFDELGYDNITHEEL